MQTPKFRIFAPQMSAPAKCRPGRPPSLALFPPPRVESNTALTTYVRAAGEDGCQELIEDTADMQKAWIEKMMEKGLCSCDEEHMFDCPGPDGGAGGGDDIGAKPIDADVEQQAFDDVLERILGEKVRLDNTDRPFCHRKY